MALRRGYVRLGGYGGADLGQLHHGGAPGSKTAAGCLLAAAVAVCSPGCGAPDQATIVAVRGCGIAPDIFGLRVQTRGDFPPGSAARAVVTEGTALVGRDIDDVAGVTVEGLVGDDFVGAVGRTTRLQRTGEIPVYYAGIDSLCEVEGEEFVVARAPGAMAVAPMGDVLIVGGTDAEGALTDEIVHVSDVEGMPRVVGNRLPLAATGQSLHAIGDRSFLAIGGAGEGPSASADAVRLDVDDDGRVDVSAPVTLEDATGPVQPRAFHAAAIWNERILVAGGCTQVDAGRCNTASGSVLRSALLIDATADPPEVQPGPTLPEARYGHQIHVARDGVLFVVGGRGVGDEPVLPIERLLPGGAWEPYGPSLEDEVADGVGIDGSALLEGGMLVVAMTDGTLRWINEDATAQLVDWCRYVAGPSPEGEPPRRNLPDVEMQEDPEGQLVPIDPCFLGQKERPDLPRPLLALPGERILADHYLVPIASPGQTGSDVVDTSIVGSRTGGLAVMLADGSVMLAGGFEPESGLPLRPVTHRLRPPLDGPDERIPTLGVVDSGSFIAMTPDRVVPEGDTLQLLAADTAEFPTVRVRVRGFRSRSFRFEVALTASSGVDPHIVLEQGAVAGLSVRLGQSIRGFARAPWGNIVDFSCGTLPDGFWGTSGTQRTLAVDVRPDSFVISHEDEVLARCPIQDLDVPVTIGVGASGSGTVTARSFRLSRI